MLGTAPVGGGSSEWRRLANKKKAKNMRCGESFYSFLNKEDSSRSCEVRGCVMGPGRVGAM